jgi:hypothetical protein
LVKAEDVHLGGRASGKLIILFLHAWFQVQAKLLPHYFFSMKSIGVKTVMGLSQQWDRVLPIKVLRVWAEGCSAV